jgi:hypothetical protein
VCFEPYAQLAVAVSIMLVEPTTTKQKTMHNLVPPDVGMVEAPEVQLGTSQSYHSNCLLPVVQLHHKVTCHLNCGAQL